MTNGVMARIIDGKKLAAEKEEKLKEQVAQFVSEFHRKPSLLAVEISDDPGSVLYLKLKRAAAARIGVQFETARLTDYRLPITIYSHVDGIFVQHPPHYDKQKWQELVDQIPPEKDVDCLTSENLRLIREGKPRFLPATVKAVLYCLGHAFNPLSSRAKSRDPATERSDIAIASLEPVLSLSKDSSTPLRSAQNDALKRFLHNKSVVILGRSPMVGLPLSWWLDSLGSNCSVLHSQSTMNKYQSAIRHADILISTIGKPGIITGDMVKEGVIMIDSGSPKGDADFVSVSSRASAITPVPGGVGPLTVVSLMENVVEAAENNLITHN